MPRTARHQSEFTTYVVPITDWHWSLSFGINPGRWPPGPYNDYRHLALSGTLLRPRRLETRAVSLTLMPTVLSETSDTPPQGVGSLNLNLALGRVLQGLLTLPIDVLAPVLVMLTADRLKYVVLDGSPLRHRHALIRNYRLEMTFDEEDYPPDD